MSIGTETDGSVCQPATRVALYAMKATVGTIDMTAIQPANPDFDSAGAMANTPSDLAVVMETITNGALDLCPPSVTKGEILHLPMWIQTAGPCRRFTRSLDRILPNRLYV